MGRRMERREKERDQGGCARESVAQDTHLCDADEHVIDMRACRADRGSLLARREPTLNGHRLAIL